MCSGSFSKGQISGVGIGNEYEENSFQVEDVCRRRRRKYLLTYFQFLGLQRFKSKTSAVFVATVSVKSVKPPLFPHPCILRPLAPCNFYFAVHSSSFFF